MVAMASWRSAGPYVPDIAMQPRPIAETSGPLFPSLRVCIAATSLPLCRRYPKAPAHRQFPREGPDDRLPQDPGTDEPRLRFPRHRVRDPVRGDELGLGAQPRL